MSDLQIDPANIIGDLIPDAYIANIILETSGPGATQPGDPHAHPGPPRRDPVTGAVEDESDPEDPSSLKVTTNILLKDTIEDNIISSWFEQQDFHKYLQVAIIVSTSKYISNVLFRADRDRNMARLVFGPLSRNRSRTQNIYGQIASRLPAAGYTAGQETRWPHIEKNLFYESFGTMFPDPLEAFEEEQDADGNIIRNISIAPTFTIPGKVNPEHLSVFAFTYLDLRALAEEVGDLDLDNISSLRWTTGRLVVQSVISDSQFVRSATYFRNRNNGLIWPGPVHQMSPGVWMGGRYHNDPQSLGNQPPLERVVIPNTTVQDFRVVANVDKRLVDFTFFEQSTFPTFNKIFRDRVKDNLPLNKTAYFSDLLLARAVGDYASMIFSFNAGKFIKEHTKYPMLLEQRPSLLSSYFLIKDLKIVRKRVKKPAKFKDEIIGYEVNPEDILDFDKESIVEIVASVGERTPGWIPGQSNRQTGNSIREIRMDVGEDVRTFSVADQQVSRETDGYYQYGVELEIHDNLNKFLSEELSTLVEYRANLYEYFVRAVQPTGRFADSSISTKNPHIFTTGQNAPSLQRSDQKGNYDQRTNRFTQKFIEEMDREYADNQSEKPWVKVVAKLSRLLMMFTSPETGREDLRGTSWRRDLWTMASPKTGSPDGISTVIKIADNVTDQIQRLIGITVSPTKGPPGGPVTPINDLNTDSRGISSAKPKKDVYKLQYWFTNAIFDANQLKETGFHYLLDKSGDPSARVGRLPGGPTVRALDFKNRIKNETLRYFTKENPDFGTSGFSVDAGLMTALAKTDISDYTYLAPSVIQPTARTPISLFDDLPSAPRLCAAVSDILNIKSPPNEPKRIPTPAAAGRRQPDEERSTVYAQVVRDNLTDVLADRGCTVELPMRAVRRPEFTVAGVRNNEVAELRGLPSIGGVLTPEDIREAAGASDTGISNYLGETPAVINQFEPETEDTVRANTQSNGDILNAGLLFLRIMYNTILENEDLVRSRRTLTLRETRDRLSINNFNLRNPDNAIERAARVRSLGPRADARGRLRPRVGGSYSFVPQLPNQIKSLFLASNPSGQTVVNDRTIFDNSNVLADPVHAIIIFLKYLNLSKIEVMTGFETTSVAVHSPVITSGASNQIGGTPNVRQKTETQLKSPTWELLTRENFQQFVGQRKEMVCRLTPYRNGIMKIKALAGIQLPVYDSYFIIRPDNPSEVRSPSLRIDTDGSSIRELVNLENVMRTIRTEYISTDPRRSIVGLSGPIDVGTTLSAPRPSIEEEPVRGQGEGRYS